MGNAPPILRSVEMRLSRGGRLWSVDGERAGSAMWREAAALEVGRRREGRVGRERRGKDHRESRVRGPVVKVGKIEWWVEGKMRVGLGRLALPRGRFVGIGRLVCFGRDDRRKAEMSRGPWLCFENNHQGPRGQWPFFLLVLGGYWFLG
ncbi:hypothetical protein H0E87_009284 [Populus deltoides]|uniref:30S ribosomal protein S16, chloroplastic n=1 Tax=Populus deltoides TaxID=3696 RepID=A0A8T2Z4K7_POPDE|nr:hypothetical protein H0E87_009284 [Populus deltoides]